jgi:hypothetical protein
MEVFMFKSIIFVLALTSLSLAGDLKLSCDVEPAWIPRAASSEYLTPKEIRYKATDNAFCLTLKPAFDWKFLYGNVELTAFSASPKEGVSFVPYRISYSNEIGLYHQFPSFKISGGWMHNCQHKVIIATYYDTKSKWNDFGYDNIFIRFHWSTEQYK